jgi:hypothetical protein
MRLWWLGLSTAAAVADKLVVSEEEAQIFGWVDLPRAATFLAGIGGRLVFTFSEHPGWG